MMKMQGDPYIVYDFRLFSYMFPGIPYIFLGTQALKQRLAKTIQQTISKPDKQTTKKRVKNNSLL